MTAVEEPPKPRQRGSVRRMRGRFQVRVSAGEDPSTGERIILTDGVPIEQPGNARSERAAKKEAEKLRTRLLADADDLKVARARATVGALLDRRMDQHEIDPTTRMTYEAQIRLYIRPKLGDVPLILFVRDAADRLEPVYARLRKCRGLCSGRPVIEKHVVEGAHDCGAAGCKPHVCKPYAALSVHSIHAILSGACSAAVRWGWISFNPMPSVRPPAKPRPQPKPPTSAQMARIVEAAWESSPEWGLYLWLSAMLGARRGEVVALQWEDLDLDAGIVPAGRELRPDCERDGAQGHQEPPDAPSVDRRADSRPAPRSPRRLRRPPRSATGVDLTIAHGCSRRPRPWAARATRPPSHVATAASSRRWASIRR